MATVNYSWTLPTVGASVNTWGTLLNTIIDDIDTKMVSKTGTQTLTNKTLTAPVITGGVTVSSGGASITGNTSVVGTLTSTGLTVTGTLQTTGTTDSTNLATGALQSSGGLSIAKNIWTGGSQFNSTATTDYEMVHRGAGGWWFYTDSATKVPLKIERLAPTNACVISATGLAVAGSVSTTSGSAVRLYRPDNAIYTDISMAAAASGGLIFNNANSDGFTFKNAGVDIAKFDTSGNLLVGATTDAANGGFVALPHGFGNGASVVDIGHKSGTASGTAYQRYFYNGSAIGSITQSGTTAVTYNTTSDHRLKTNVRPANAARFMQIEFVDFEWVDGRHDCGVIADQLQSVYPDLVIGEKDATEIRTVEITPAVPAVTDRRLMEMPQGLTDDEIEQFKSVDTNYEFVEVTPAIPAVTEEQTVPVYQQVNYMGLIGRMGTRVQALQRTVDDLTARLAALESRA